MTVKELFESSRQKLSKIFSQEQDMRDLVSLHSVDEGEEVITPTTSSIKNRLPSQESRGISNETAKAVILKIKESCKDDPYNLFNQVHIDD